MTRFLLPTMLIALASLAACTGGEKKSEQPVANVTNAAEKGAAARLENATTPAPAADAFTRYVGKYPFDKVGDHSWHDDPAVMQAIETAVSDRSVRKWVLGDNGPATPIASLNGKIASWSCEAHNCGPHQWVTLVDPRNGLAEICYFDEEVAADRTRWFSDGKDETRAGKCPEVSG